MRTGKNWRLGVYVGKISEPSKYKALKDAGKSHFPCATLIPCIIITVFCITGAKLMVLFEISKKKEKYKNCADYTRVRDKVSMQTVLTALIFQHKQAEPQVYCQKSNRLLGQNIGS